MRLGLVAVTWISSDHLPWQGFTVAKFQPFVTPWLENPEIALLWGQDKACLGRCRQLEPTCCQPALLTGSCLLCSLLCACTQTQSGCICAWSHQISEYIIYIYIYVCIYVYTHTYIRKCVFASTQTSFNRKHSCYTTSQWTSTGQLLLTWQGLLEN